MTTATKIGDFSHKFITFTFLPGPTGSTLVQCNCEGTTTGFGFVAGTFTACSAGQKAGTWSWCGASYPESGDSVITRAEGSFSDAGQNCWRTVGLVSTSDGRSMMIEGQVDMAARSWSGGVFERG